jgi:nicotinamide mononucleotide (NMN) deamidase PncC
MNTTTELIAALHAGPLRMSIVATGAAAGLQRLVTSVPGASATLLSSAFPYDQHALSDYLGFKPAQFASEETALAMAARAWRHAHELSLRRGDDPGTAIGLAATGVIASNRAIRGEHRLFLAVRAGKGFLSAKVTFPKREDGLSRLGRELEAETADLLALNMALYAADLSQVGVAGDGLLGDLAERSGGLLALLPRPVTPTVAPLELSPETHVLFDGSFNPWHYGHEKIAAEVELRTGKKVAYVITDSHPDKGSVQAGELAARVAQFQLVAPILVTENLRLYVDKADAHPGFARIIGADTLARVLDPKYGVPTDEVLRRLEASGASFFVADRPHGKDAATFDSLRARIPSHYLGMFTRLSTTADISSTVARQASAS